ncbi:hypothetical protein SAMN05444365_10575 [Micromonospora pattaloongensis]|uniref:DUF2314 domain-containing protein n=1 Tax=Micromonospora pattaloongensis TaxID=405436 RepID=A0A1H3PX03_9ACTN|nr:DUF2314 domain-containing protein [Micromonospora pattaloongensis]SDZ05451.1 hypothetical protein SAMN05444365_10575 [Micromonospora pattaloongensis]
MAITDEFLPVPVPESLSATYLVPTARGSGAKPAEAVAALGERLSDPVGDLALQMIDSPLMTVDTRPVSQFPELPPDLLAAFGATPGQLEQLRTANELVVVQAGYRPGWPPVHEWSARAVAAAIAQSLDGDLIDVFSLQFLDPATALRSLPDNDGRLRLVDWILVPYSPTDTGLWFTTKGLRRFGLLELQAQEVPAQFTRAWGAIMTGAARRLLRIWTESLTEQDVPAFVQLPIETTVTGHDIAVAYGSPERHDSAGSAGLRLDLDPATDPDADSFLTLLPPAGQAAAPAEYFAQICTRLFGSGQPEIRYTRPSDAMARAVETARRSLRSARDRFLIGGLPPGVQLVVKYGLATDEGQEFVWASVTSWSNPGRIVATSTSDAASDPTVRVGTPVVVETADVVDWALLDGRGVIEGGWTQAVLDERL